RGVDLGGKGAVVDRRDLGLPVGEVGPHRLTAGERVGGLVGVAWAGREPGAEGALTDEDLLVEVLVTGPDGLEEIDRGVLGRARRQDVPARATFVRVVGGTFDASQLRNGSDAPLARELGLGLDGADHPDAID